MIMIDINEPNRACEGACGGERVWLRATRTEKKDGSCAIESTKSQLSRCSVPEESGRFVSVKWTNGY